MILPADIVYEILLLLPAKSLIRLRVVCKDWYSHIQSKSFISKHIKNQRGNENMLIYHYQNRNYVVSICSEEEKQDDDEVDGDAFRTSIHQQQYFIKHMPLEHLKKPVDYAKVEIIGTCNGIVCLACTEGTLKHIEKIITLWNPATREFNTLPSFQLRRPPGTTDINSNDVCFGFDSTTDDYKIMRISYCKKKGVPWLQEEYIIQMKMYSLSTNSWREFDCSGLSAIKVTQCPYRNYSTLFGNKFCWLAKNIGNIRSKERFILSFDMGKEVFQETPLPSEYVQFGEKYYKMKLLHMHDSLALVFYDATNMGLTFEIWTTKDLEQGNSSWIKFTSAGPISKIREPRGFWKCRKNEDCLFVFTDYDDDAMMGIYINNQGQVKNKRPMIIKDANNNVGFLNQASFTYIETLVSVKRNHSLVVV